MYKYQTEKARIFTEDGQVMFLKIRDRVNELLAKAGAFRMLEAIAGVTGDTWMMLACVDRMVELGELRELTAANVLSQHRVFTR